MGMFGKYAIWIECSNGDKGYYMSMIEGHIALAGNENSAERFLTKSGARGFASGIDWSVPVIGDRGISSVVSVDLVELFR